MLGAKQQKIGADAALVCVGANNYGQLGVGSSADAKLPISVQAFAGKQLKCVASGYDHTIVIAEDGDVFSFGLYGAGRLDPKRKMYRSEPVLRPTISSKQIQTLACGKDFTIFSTKSQTFAFGTNANGQLGLGSTKQTRAIENEPQLVEGMNGKEVIEIVCGAYHTMARSETELFTWGSNRFGQLAHGIREKQLTDPTRVENLDGFSIRSMAAGAYHTIAVVEAKAAPGAKGSKKTKAPAVEVLAVGYNNSGQLGLTPAPQPVCRYRFRKVAGLSNVGINTVACGWFHTIVANMEGQMYAFGCNANGQLGMGDTKNRTAPERVFGFKPIPSQLSQFEMETIWECQRPPKDRILTPLPGRVRVRKGFAMVNTTEDVTKVLQRGDLIRIGMELFRVNTDPNAFMSEFDLPLDRPIEGESDRERMAFMLDDDQKKVDRMKVNERAVLKRHRDMARAEAEGRGGGGGGDGAKQAGREAKEEAKGDMAEAKAEAKLEARLVEHAEEKEAGTNEVQEGKAEDKAGGDEAVAEGKAAGEKKGGEEQGAEAEEAGKKFTLFDEENKRQRAYAELKKAAPAEGTRDAMTFDSDAAKDEAFEAEFKTVKTEAEKGVIETADMNEPKGSKGGVKDGGNRDGDEDDEEEVEKETLPDFSVWELADVWANESGSFPETPDPAEEVEEDPDAEPDPSKALEAAKPPWWRPNQEHGNPLCPRLEKSDVRRRQKLLTAFYIWEHRADFGGPAYNLVSVECVATVDTARHAD